MADSLIYSRKLHIATGSKRTTKVWQNRESEWRDIVKSLQRVSYTGETVAQYHDMGKREKDERKDVGGFVGGYLEDGRRLTQKVKLRSMLTLDADSPSASFKDDLTRVLGENAYALYSTHSYTKEKPRYRVVVPLSEDVEPDAYQAVARKVADDIGMHHFDPTTFDTARLFYWPSAPTGGDFECAVNDKPLLEPKRVLAAYVDWRDCTSWPTSANETAIRKTDFKKLGEPTEKPGLIGAFCRVYTIQGAIEKYLSDVYEPTDDPGRYTYAAGTTTGGLVIYDDKFAYSHHGTDPVSGLDVNAFDLVRTHLFGLEDEEAKADTPVNKLPSFKSMTELAENDEKVRQEWDDADTKALQESWDDSAITPEGMPVEVDKSWLAELTRAKKGGFESSPENVLTILGHDITIKGLPAYDEFSHRVVSRGALPWRKDAKDTIWTDADDACLRNYLFRYYSISGKQMIDDALTETVVHNAFHPVRDYLESLVWDGTPRVRTLFTDYLGAANTTYEQEVTCTSLKAAVARILHPGIKFDNCTVLYGRQGIGKSTLLAKLGGRWFNDSIASIQNKDSLEQLQGSWLIELQEMQATNRAGNDQIKSFLSKSSDKFRVAYGRRTEEYKRQCVFFATTNEDICLKDRTGGRRFWIIECTGTATKSVFDIDGYTRDQIWAEAMALYQQDASLRLSPESEARAREIQEAKTEGSELVGIIKSYLNTPVPANWNKMAIAERHYFVENGETDGEEETQERFLIVKTCALAIWCECLGGNRLNFNNAKAREINTILANLDGWERYKGNKRGVLKFKGYGAQRAYVRIKKDDDNAPQKR